MAYRALEANPMDPEAQRKIEEIINRGKRESGQGQGRVAWIGLVGGVVTLEVEWVGGRMKCVPAVGE